MKNGHLCQTWLFGSGVQREAESHGATKIDEIGTQILGGSVASNCSHLTACVKTFQVPRFVNSEETEPSTWVFKYPNFVFVLSICTCVVQSLSNPQEML